MKESKFARKFPNGFFFQSSSNSCNPSPSSFINETVSLQKHKKLVFLSPRIKKKIKAEDLIFAAHSAREEPVKISEPKYTLGLDNTKRYSSSKILPPLKPTLHVSSYTPRKILPVSPNNLLTITFSSKEIKPYGKV